MNTTQLNSLLARTALEILRNERLPYNQRTWIKCNEAERSKACNSQVNPANICGTACCFLGHAYMIHNGLTTLTIADGEHISAFCVLCFPIYTQGHFLWSSEQVSTPEQCAVRCLMWLTDQVPDEADQYDAQNNALSYPVPDDLVEQLESFI